MAFDFSTAKSSQSQYETKLSSGDEANFQKWKAQYAPKDSGVDYDLRGAYKAGLKPSAENGHWPDTFKKPNHPTFSNESIYAKDAPEKAGSWNGDTYVPPASKGSFDFSTAKPVAAPAASDSIPARISRAVIKGISIPLNNPIANTFEDAGGKVSGAVGSIGDRLIKKAQDIGPHVGLGIPEMAVGSAGSAIKLAGDAGKLTPTNLAPMVGGEAMLRIAAPAIASMAGTGIKKAGAFMTGVPEEAITSALKKPSILDASMEGAAKDMPEVAGKFNQAISHISDIAKEKLSTSRFLEATGTDPGGAFTKDEVIGAVTNARKKLGGVYTPESESAAKVLDKIKGNFGKVRSTVSQNQVHDLIRDLDAEIPWTKVWKTPETLTATDEALIDARTGLDSMLKKKNTEYATEMSKVSDLIGGRNEFMKKMGLTKVKGEGIIPSDQTVTKMKGALNENKVDVARVLGKTKNLIGEDVTPKIQEASQGEAFAAAGKSKKFTAAGAAVGGVIGAKAAGYAGAGAGAATGAAAGGMIDAAAPKILGNLVRIAAKGRTFYLPLEYAPFSLGLRAIPHFAGQGEESRK